MTLIADSKRQCLLIAGDDNEIFMTRSLNFMPKTTGQYLTARSDKSVAYATNNKRLCSTFRTTEAKKRRNWLQQVEEDVGLSVGVAWIAGQDRSMWRTLRPSAGQAQQ